MSFSTEQEEELILIISVVGEYRSNLSARSREFFDEQVKRYDEHKSEMWLSAKQWSWLRDLYQQATR